ncbi:hypothetical protein GmRootV15_14830 [Variovorax sp. V15]
MISGSLVVTSRAVASLPPPGGKGEMNFTGCDGKPLRGAIGSAVAGWSASAASQAAAAASLAIWAMCGMRLANDMTELLE